MDTLTPEERSRNMARIRGKNTRPELQVRSMLHRAGYRFSLHRKNLPGKPDIVLRKYRTVIFVHGCFWHRHKNCKQATTPKSNIDFWQAKFDRNVANDKKHVRDLRRLGWRVITVWECELKNPEKVLARLERLLTADHADDADRIIPYTTQEETAQPMAAEKQARYRARKQKKR